MSAHLGSSCLFLNKLRSGTAQPKKRTNLGSATQRSPAPSKRANPLHPRDKASRKDGAAFFFFFFNVISSEGQRVLFFVFFF